MLPTLCVPAESALHCAPRAADLASVAQHDAVALAGYGLDAGFLGVQPQPRYIQQIHHLPRQRPEPVAQLVLDFAHSRFDGVFAFIHFAIRRCLPLRRSLA